jgi:hypothetical protein
VFTVFPSTVVREPVSFDHYAGYKLKFGGRHVRQREKSARTYLSKSLYIRGLQCPKSLWLDRYQPGTRDEIGPSQERVFQNGIEVGRLAQRLFPGGIEIPHEGLTYAEKVEKTAAYIRDGTTTLYEASFSFDDIFVKADILHKSQAGWDVYEVKGTTAVKDIHVDDAAIQYYTVAGSGLLVVGVSLVHINNEYLRQGPLDVHKLFVSEDITYQVRNKQSNVMGQIQLLRTMLQGAMPEVYIGKQCSDPYDCDFHGYCWRHVPEYSIFRLGGSKAKISELYSKGLLHLDDVAPHLLSGSQRLVLEAYLEKKELVRAPQVKEFLDSLWYPLCFLDFETFSVPIPPFDNTWPYQHIPYQYSLHYLADEGAPLAHHEFLAQPATDPRVELIEKLLSEIPSDACVLAYNAGYEARILSELAGSLPRYRGRIETILPNIRDLAGPFRMKAMYHWQMMGSYSQKAVLPAFIPDLSYARLEIGDGGAAMEAYFRMCESEDGEEIATIRRNLLDYCRLDTLGTVRLYERLRELR